MKLYHGTSHTTAILADGFDLEAQRTMDPGDFGWGVYLTDSPSRARAHGKVLVVEVEDSRSQGRNRQIARSRMRVLLVAALRTQKVRRPTRPTRAAQRQRVDEKKARGETKRLRSRPRHDDPQ